MGSISAQTRTERNQQTHFDAFREQTLPHIDAIYSDALCLTGNREDAANLVEATYVRSFQGFEQFRHRRVPAQQREHNTLAWLYANLHAVFCEGILARFEPDVTLIGEQR